jgi:hypothetical protein
MDLSDNFIMLIGQKASCAQVRASSRQPDHPSSKATPSRNSEIAEPLQNHYNPKKKAPPLLVEALYLIQFNGAERGT